MRILVTGGAGFVGSHTVDVLLNEGHEVVVLDNLDPQVHGEVVGPPPNLLAHVENDRCRFVRGDVRDRAALAAALSGVDGVLHLAAAVGVGQSMYEPFHYCSVNVGGTAQLLDILATEKTSVQQVVVASSMSIYGEGAYSCASCGDMHPPQRDVRHVYEDRWELMCPRCQGPLVPIPTREAKPLAPTSIYSVTKRTQEELVLQFGAAHELPVTALRYFNIYGPRQSLSNPYTGVVAIFISRLLNHKPPIVFEDGIQSRDFVHVRDVARANVLALTSSQTDSRAVNVGTGEAVSIVELYRQLSEILDVPIDPTFVRRFRAGDVRHCFSDSTLAASLVGWQSQVALSDGLNDLVRWCRDTSPVAQDSVDRAYKELEAKNLLR